MKKTILLVVPLALAFTGARGDVTLPPLISDNLLLQSTKAVVWGKADPGEKVTVKLGKSEASATADKDGRWSVKLLGLTPGTPGELTVTGKNSLTVKNVAVGDVWVCSGQSNMEMTLKSGANPTGGVVNFEKEIAEANHPDIRMFIVPKKASETPVEELDGKWEVCTPEVAPKWSAVGYFFGRKLNADLNIPIGLIHTSWGGTSAQAWTPTDVIQGDPDFNKSYWEPRQKDLANIDALKAKYNNETLPAWQAQVDAAKAAGKEAPRKPRPPYGPGEGPTVSALYNKMIHGATKYGIKGAIWYQGETNAGEGDRYRRLLPAMITSWRKAWNQPDFPFYIVQLANFMAPTADPVDSNWANLRDAQRLTAETLPNTGLATIIDIGEEKSIHPANKQDVGIRLALVAEAKTYGKAIVYSGPVFDQATFEGSSAKITFKPGTAEGLKTTDGAPIRQFAIAGEDKKFVWAETKIETPEAEPIVVLSAPGVEKPVAVRYAWANNPAVNLVNAAGLPAVPFRTDDWPQAQPKPTATPAPSVAPAASPAAAK
ncbi:MAG: sialate O-acetylesterase [Chthoniobacteraceae bacterium]